MSVITTTAATLRDEGILTTLALTSVDVRGLVDTVCSSVGVNSDVADSHRAAELCVNGGSILDVNVSASNNHQLHLIQSSVGDSGDKSELSVVLNWFSSVVKLGHGFYRTNF
jgi:hypothetical protein